MNDPYSTTTMVLGADFELANAIVGKSPRPARHAAATLLDEMPGFPREFSQGTSIEHGRRFSDSCGSSAYIDSDHLECNLPEHTSAFDFPNILHGAGFRQALHAMRRVQAKLPPGTMINVLANCSDGRTSWGSHLNIMLSRQCFHDLLHRRPHLAAFFATHLVTSVPYTGQGLVGAANGRPACSYQLSQRADWFETFLSIQTMVERPLINLRDESHAEAELARFHIIYFDNVLSPVANILKAGTSQLILAMIETGWADHSLSLDDPLAAASEISRDLSLRLKLPTVVRGRRLTAIEIQEGLANLAGEFVVSGAAAGIVPDAERIVSLWLDTIELLKSRDIDALARRCDAWLKYALLDRQRASKGVSWSSEHMRVADSLFASLDPNISLFFQAAATGFVERMPDERTIERWRLEPPEDTRAYFRAHVLRRYGNAVSFIDWSRIRFRVQDTHNWWSVAEIQMRNPLRFNRAETEQLLSEDLSLEDFVDAANSLAHDSIATSPATGSRPQPAQLAPDQLPTP